MYSAENIMVSRLKNKIQLLKNEFHLIFIGMDKALKDEHIADIKLIRSELSQLNVHLTEDDRKLIALFYDNILKELMQRLTKDYKHTSVHHFGEHRKKALQTQKGNAYLGFVLMASTFAHRFENEYKNEITALLTEISQYQKRLDDVNLNSQVTRLKKLLKQYTQEYPNALMGELNADDIAKISADNTPPLEEHAESKMDIDEDLPIEGTKIEVNPYQIVDPFANLVNASLAKQLNSLREAITILKDAPTKPIELNTYLDIANNFVKQLLLIQRFANKVPWNTFQVNPSEFYKQSRIVFDKLEDAGWRVTGTIASGLIPANDGHFNQFKSVFEDQKVIDAIAFMHNELLKMPDNVNKRKAESDDENDNGHSKKSKLQHSNRLFDTSPKHELSPSPSNTSHNMKK